MREKEVRGLMEAYSQVHAPQELTEEQVWKEVESWVNSLIEEGHDLSDSTWEELYEAYIEEVWGTKPGQYKPNKLDTAVSNIASSIANFGKAPPRPAGSRYAGPGVGWVEPKKPATTTPKPAATPDRSSAAKPTATPVSKPAAAAKPTAPAAKQTGDKAKDTATWAKANPKLAAAAAERDRTRGTSATTNPLMKDMKSKLPEPKPAPTLAGTVAAASKPTAFDPSSNASTSSSAKPTTPVNKATGSKKPGSIVSGVDLFDIVKGYLLDEGYAESEDAAMVIMVNMSEGWKESILESCGVELVEISKELALKAHAERGTREFESDGDNPQDFTKSGKSKADESERRIVKKHGEGARREANRAAEKRIYGHNKYSEAQERERAKKKVTKEEMELDESDSIAAMRERAAKRRKQRYGASDTSRGGRDDFKPYTEDDYKKGEKNDPRNTRKEEYMDESQYARENPEKYERDARRSQSSRERRMNDPKTGINSPAFQAFMAQQMGGKKKKKD